MANFSYFGDPLTFIWQHHQLFKSLQCVVLCLITPPLTLEFPGPLQNSVNGYVWIHEFLFPFIYTVNGRGTYSRTAPPLLQEQSPPCYLFITKVATKWTKDKERKQHPTVLVLWRRPKKRPWWAHTLKMLNLTVLHSLLNFTATVHLLNIFNQILSPSPLLSSSFSSNFFISSQLSLMYIAPSNKRHKINLLLSICALQNLPASDQYTFRLDDKSVCARTRVFVRVCVCVCALACIHAFVCFGAVMH